MSECNKCNGTLFVCENHPDQEAHQCKHYGGAGMPCECTKISEPIGNTKQLAEPVAVRYDFDGYGYMYMDAGSGSDWASRVKDCEFLYTHPMRELSRKDFLEIWENEVNKFHDVEEYDIANFARAIIKASRGEK